MEELMIKIENVSKQYKIGQIGGTTLREELQRRHARLRGKQDPTIIIGDRDDQAGETFLALDGVSFDVGKGERIGIIGHNGAGKSTLLKLLSRVTAPTSGRIRLNGRVASMLEVGTGFHPELTGRENIYMNGAILGMTKKEIDTKIEDIIDFSEVRQFIDTPVKRYSSGMYVKLAFSVAAHLDSEIMIMDEVLAVGDMKFQEKCLGKMGEISRVDSRTILYVSHNMNTIRNLCNRCVLLEHGKAVYIGEVEEAISQYISSSSLSENYVELENKERPAAFIDPAVTIKSIFVETENSIFNNQDIFAGNLKVHSMNDYLDVRLELLVRTASGIPVTRFYSDSCIELHKDETTEVRFSMDISQIAPGKYVLSPIVRQVNSWGTNKNLDGLANIYCFEIAQRPGRNKGTEWNTNNSGYYMAPAISVHVSAEK